MAYCVVPTCQNPHNPEQNKICQNCGFKLWLKNRYRPVSIIGQGGFGRTFLAIDEDIPSKPNCVIKQLYLQSADPDILKKALELFQKEAIRLDILGQHPQIPSLFAYFQQDQWFYLVQEYIDGKNLAEEIQEKGLFSEAEIYQLLQDLLDILQYIHQNQVIHRDIKPANIMRRYSDNKLVLIDFGIAKVFAANDLDKTATIIGTPEFMAPEQMRGKSIPASDLYSLGLTCIYLLTGVSPSNLFDFTKDSFSWRDYLPTTCNNIPETKLRISVGQVIDKLLQNAVKERYLSAAEALAALKSSVQSSSPQNSIKTSKQPPIQPIPPTLPSPPPPTVINPKNKVSSQPIYRSGSSRPSLMEQMFGWANKSPKESDILESDAGVDYSQLQNFLASRNWQQADEETKKVLCLGVGKRFGYLDVLDIEKIPPKDLQTIDRLWVKYSEGKFGFSVQTAIFNKVGGEYSSFCGEIGWPVTNTMDYKSFTYSLKAPKGHLPSRNWSGGYHWWKHAAAMAAKIESCF
ncbi:serine/threonine-protein kinase [Ancylothrix sp. C2]|uniref:serine/threonine-protein kinase n=1 Tax=Ancylothrix sp. D3o TaxID=2953691 RepID=UPI0021BB1ADB|nr:serine/threonine-protein kinase [Ancylothrix sp. D3o]MCT7948854.1 serine/threonine-protein kinase [Ancylothrix sp. D3o]